MALAKLGRYNDHVVALDGDTKNSTFSELFKNEHPNRYVECYIAEQNMVQKRCSLSSLEGWKGFLDQCKMYEDEVSQKNIRRAQQTLIPLHKQLKDPDSEV